MKIWLEKMERENNMGTTEFKGGKEGNSERGTCFVQNVKKGERRGCTIRTKYIGKLCKMNTG